MHYQHCEAFGFNTENIKKRIRLLELSEKDASTSTLMQQIVIEPNAAPIINKFYTFLGNHKEFISYLSSDDIISRLKKTQLLYLNTLGMGFSEPEYFDLRLRIGVAHHRIGMPLNLYICAYSKLLSLILEQIPSEFEEKVVKSLQVFATKIVNLDISLAIDSYVESNIEQLETSIDNLEKKAKKLKRQSEIDPLTNIANRMTILGYLRHKMQKAKEKRTSLCLIMLDINDLDKVNNSFGHLIGDLLLKSTLEKINHMLESKDKIGRYGGDEFLIVTSRNLDQARSLSNSILDEIAHNAFKIGEHQLNISLAYGITEFKADDAVPTILNRVDKELIKNKNTK